MPSPIIAAAKPELKQRRGAGSDSSDVYYIYVCIKDPNKVNLLLSSPAEIFKGSCYVLAVCVPFRSVLFYRNPWAYGKLRACTAVLKAIGQQVERFRAPRPRAAITEDDNLEALESHRRLALHWKACCMLISRGGSLTLPPR